MPKVKKEILDWAKPGSMPERWFFYCPGCQQAIKAKNPDYDEEACRELAIHAINVETVHTFNGNPDAPTFKPSIMYNFTPGYVCHSYVTAGKIQFLSDCTHSLAGQTIELPEMD